MTSPAASIGVVKSRSSSQAIVPNLRIVEPIIPWEVPATHHGSEGASRGMIVAFTTMLVTSSVMGYAPWMLQTAKRGIRPEKAIQSLGPCSVGRRDMPPSLHRSASTAIPHCRGPGPSQVGNDDDPDQPAPHA